MQATVDVRDMLCAQALALVGKASQRLAAGQALTVRYNSADVAQDVSVWIRDRGYRIAQQDEASVTFQR